MLVLSRKKGQVINIGHNIRILVIDIQKDHVRLGIEAPTDVDIYRSEIYAAIQNENLQAIAKQDAYKYICDNYKPDKVYTENEEKIKNRT